MKWTFDGFGWSSGFRFRASWMSTLRYKFLRLNSTSCQLDSRQFNSLAMSLIFRRRIASLASLKKASKVVCIGRNYAFVPPTSVHPSPVPIQSAID